MASNESSGSGSFGDRFAEKAADTAATVIVAAVAGAGQLVVAAVGDLAVVAAECFGPAVDDHLVAETRRFEFALLGFEPLAEAPILGRQSRALKEKPPPVTAGAGELF